MSTELRFQISVEQESEPVDHDFDDETREKIHARLDRGDVWAWCAVTVTASVRGDGAHFTGKCTLYGCSYDDEEDFRAGGYYEDMCRDALYDLQEALKRAIARGELARDVLARLYEVKK